MRWRSWHGRRGRCAAGVAGRGVGGQARPGRAGACGRWQGAGGGGRASGLARGVYLVQPRHGSGRGTAAPRSVARRDLPRHRSPSPALATSALCRATMHDAALAFGRAMAIGAAKSVSLKKNPTVLDLKLVIKKC